MTTRWTVADVNVVVPSVRACGPRACVARRLLWLAAHVTSGRASWRLLTLATRLIVPGGDDEAQLAFLACALARYRAR